MKITGRGSRTLGMALAAAFLTACSGSQVDGPSAMQIHNASAKHIQGHSWMLPEATGRDLIYATGGCGGTCVLSYPKGQLVGELAYNGYADCSANNGDVFISSQTDVLEFAHGGTTPIASYAVPYTPPVGCSVDPESGNLAVVSSAFVEIFPKGSTNSTSYDTLLDAQFCGYDNSGNLYVSGYDGENSGLSELPKGGSGFIKLSLDQSVGQPGQVQWDGQHISYESDGPGQPTITQLSVSGSSTKIEGQTFLKKVPNRLAQSWIYKGSVIAPYSVTGRNAKNIGIWKYPKGGWFTRRIKNFGDFDKKTFAFSGVTISVAP